MFDIPTILSAQELLDKAFKRASKADYQGSTRLETVREINIAKLKSSSDTIVTTLGRYVKSFPSIERLSPFYASLVDVVVGRDRLKKSLGAMDWCRGNVARVAKAAVKEISKSRSISEIDELRRAAYGRISSLVHQVEGELAFLSSARDRMRRFPAVSPSLPTIVVAGAPNVGKSQLVSRISSARPKVAEYPFTTQEVSVGTLERRYQRFQVIDTPGLLDRELTERNPIELRAILALKHLATVIIFMYDPTETCGYTMAAQEHILATIRREFGSIPVIEVENKVDLLNTGSPRLKISATTGKGVKALVDRALAECARGQAL